MHVTIYRPARTAMQSGQANTRRWIVEPESDPRHAIEPLMGWTASADTRRQVRLSFDTLDEAVAYAAREGLTYTVVHDHPRAQVKKSYADNFAFHQIEARSPACVPKLPAEG